MARAILHHGKEMSYNNYLDAEAAYSCVSDFPSSDPSCVVGPRQRIKPNDEGLSALRGLIVTMVFLSFHGVPA